MVKIKVLNIISGIIGLVFIIIFAILTIVTDYIKIGGFFIFSIILVLIIILIDLTFFLIKKNKKIVVEKEGEKKKVMSLEEAREISKKTLQNEQFSEYEKEVKFESIWGMGNTNTPIYVKIVIGQFENLYYTICVNLENSIKRSIREHPLTIDMKDLISILEREANLVAAEPKPLPRTEEELRELPTGERIIRKRDIAEEKKQEGGGLK